MKALALATTATLLFPAPGAWAGVFLETVEKDLRSGAETLQSRTYIDAGRVRTEVLEGDRVESVVIFAEDRWYLVDPGRKVYQVMEPQAMKARMSQAQAMLDEQLRSLPPEQRAMIERQLGGAAGAPGVGAAPGARATASAPVARRIGRSETVSGKTCELWEVSHGGVADTQHCVVPVSQIPEGAQTRAALERMAASMQEAFGDMPGLGAEARTPFQELRAIDGFPILTRDLDQGKVVGETRVQNLRSESIEAGQFAPPPGYREEKPDSDADR
jgi:hypothetical protein